MPPFIPCCNCLRDSLQHRASLSDLYNRLRLHFLTDGDVFHQIMEHSSWPEPEPNPGAPTVEKHPVEALDNAVGNGFCGKCQSQL